MGETLDFAQDTQRYKYFVPESKEHGAKLELRTYQFLVERYTTTGQTILDPMSGVGTVHFAATLGRNTIAIEIAPRFVEIQRLNIAKLHEVCGLTGSTLLYEGDCRRYLPFPQGVVDAVIFSPPYGAAFSGGVSNKGKNFYHGYSSDAGNIGNITIYPLYLEAMKEVYKLCNRSLPPGGVLISVTKDYVRLGERIYVSKDNLRAMMEAGFRFEDWHVRKAHSTLGKLSTEKSRNEKAQLEGTTVHSELTIRTEDILVMRKSAEA